MADARPFEGLPPIPFRGEALRFDLAPHRSLATRQLLQLRVRLTARAFGTGTGAIAANLVDGGAVLEVDAAALAEANEAVRSRLEAGPVEAVRQLRHLAAARADADRRASAFEPAPAGSTPGSRGRTRQASEAGASAAATDERVDPGVDARSGSGDALGYVEAVAVLSALGSLKFCMPTSLRSRLAELLAREMVDPLLAPDGPTMWSLVRGRELALARRRATGPAEVYRRRLAAHQRAFGYLLGEDVDFRDFESIDALDARVVALATDDIDGERRRLADALGDDAAAKDAARQAFADALQASDGVGVTTLVSHVLLARALTEHEDVNRRAKVRLLRDLRDLAEARGLDIRHAGLDELLTEPEPVPIPVGVA